METEEITLGNYVRKPICFNVDNANQRALLTWMNAQSEDNFSGFAKTLLYAAYLAANKKTDATTSASNVND